MIANHFIIIYGPRVHFHGLSISLSPLEECLLGISINFNGWYLLCGRSRCTRFPKGNESGWVLNALVSGGSMRTLCSSTFGFMRIYCPFSQCCGFHCCTLSLFSTDDPFMGNCNSTELAIELCVCAMVQKQTKE